MIDERIVSVILPVVFTLGGTVFLITRINIRKNGVSTTAVVVKTVQVDGGVEWGYSYCPILRYQANGREFETKYNVGRMSPWYKDGEVLEIMYNRKKPNKIIVENDKLPLFMIWSWLVVGLLSFLLFLYKLST